MATISTRSGRKILQFAHHGKRRTVTLGQISNAEAEQIRLHVGRLVDCYAASVPPDAELVSWTGRTTGRLRDALTACGFADQTLTVGEYLARSPSAGTSRRQRLAKLLERRLGRVPIHALTAEHALAIRNELTGNANTIAAKLTDLRAIFRPAVKRGLIQFNPFDDLKPPAHADNTQPSKRRFVTREEIAAVMDLCPDAELRAIVALGRYAGLRIPSELEHLKWADIDWSAGKLTITDTKRGRLRVIPLFPELVEPLRDAYEAAQDGSGGLLGKYRGQPLGRILGRLVRRAGLRMWRKPWNSLRASRETELIEAFPIHTACYWIGNSPSVALKHYTMVREEHYATANGLQFNPPAVAARGGLLPFPLPDAAPATPACHAAPASSAR